MIDHMASILLVFACTNRLLNSKQRRQNIIMNNEQRETHKQTLLTMADVIGIDSYANTNANINDNNNDNINSSSSSNNSNANNHDNNNNISRSGDNSNSSNKYTASFEEGAIVWSRSSPREKWWPSVVFRSWDAAKNAGFVPDGIAFLIEVGRKVDVTDEEAAPREGEFLNL